MASINVYDTITIDILNKYNNDNTKIISKALNNPSLKDVQDIMESTKHGFEMNVNRIFRLLCKAMPMLSNKILQPLSYKILDILPKDANDTILKNTYAKLHFWMSEYFIEALRSLDNGKEYTIIFEKTPSKYEIVCLYLLYELGCNIDIIDDNDGCAEYKEKFKNLKFTIADNSGKYSKNNIVCSDLEDLYTQITNGIALWNAYVVGTDSTGKLENFAYNFYTFLNENNLEYKIIDSKLGFSESAFKINKALLGISDKGVLIEKAIEYVVVRPEIKDELKILLYRFIENEVSNLKIRQLAFIIDWLNQYCDMSEKGVLWIINSTDEVEKEFIKIVRQLPICILHMNTSKDNYINEFDASLILDGTSNKFEIPKHGVVTVGQTLAYEATKRVDELIYNGETIGVYRDNQYNKNQVIIMNSTFDEVFIYWNQDVMYRPHFKSDANKVTVPVLLMQVTGWSDEYKKNLPKLLGDNTIWLDVDNELSLSRQYNDIVYKSLVKGVQTNRVPIAVRNGEVDKELIKMSPNYPYRYINYETESLIFDKLQELISKELIICKDNKKDKLNDLIINVIMSLDRHIINMIQAFDFTKINPKLIITQEGTNIISVELAIIAAFLHLVGFDVLVFIPTKYRGIEEHIDGRIIQQIELSNANYNNPYKDSLNHKEKEKNGGLLGKLFRK